MIRELKRLKLTLSKPIYERLLDEINRANKDLREITHQNVYLEPHRKKRRSKRPMSELGTTRAHARSLHNVLIMGTKWKCRCRNHHTTSLRLDIEDPSAGSILRQKFRILMSSTVQHDNKLSRVGWQEFEVVPILQNQNLAPYVEPAHSLPRYV